MSACSTCGLQASTRRFCITSIKHSGSCRVAALADARLACWLNDPTVSKVIYSCFDRGKHMQIVVRRHLDVFNVLQITQLFRPAMYIGRAEDTRGDSDQCRMRWVHLIFCQHRFVVGDE
eukprot:TRINITY_DN74850_c0_g1_i1.p2 TRINITY_DN74850_c0_g1~~TRINITY_DN74850_c0_g1_i1.p2  ORF type:complete len:119 (-),score=5.87 TRINITY_DN74850_c0_g1_i1:200-556(-)